MVQKRVNVWMIYNIYAHHTPLGKRDINLKIMMKDTRKRREEWVDNGGQIINTARKGER